MTATLVLSVAVNKGWVERLAKSRGCPAVDVAGEAVGILEGRLVDAVRHYAAVAGPVTSNAYIDGARVRREQ